MEKKQIKIKLSICIISTIIIIAISIFVIAYYKTKKQNDYEIGQTLQQNQSDNFNEEKENIITIIWTPGLHAGSKNIQEIYMNENDFFITPDKLQNMLGFTGVQFDSATNSIKIGTYLTIDITTGIVNGKMGISDIIDKKMETLPIIENNQILLPMKAILDIIKPGEDKIFFDEKTGILRVDLQDFEYDFLKAFPYSIIGSYKSNSVLSYGQSIDIAEEGLIYKKDDKYGLVSYKVEEYMEGNTRRGKFISYNIDIEACYNQIEFIPYDYNIYVLRNGNKSIIYNRKLKNLSEEYDSIQEIQNGDHNYKVEKNGKYGVYSVSETIYDDVWYEEGETTGTNIQITRRGIYGSINGKKFLIKELSPTTLCY